jgi:transcriptional regulator with XRE-family HTH domain
MSDFNYITDSELLKLRKIRASEYLLSLRTERNLTQKTVASNLAISAQYLSEIEKNNRTPSDCLLHALSEVFELGLEGEVDLFHKYGRMPLLTAEELEDQKSTHFAFAQLRKLVKDGKISDEQRQEFYTEFDKMFRDFLSRVLPSKEDCN